MRKIFMLIPALVLTLFASGYEEAIDKGIGEGKNVLFMVTTKGCPWCMTMKESVIPDGEVQDELKDYVFVELDRDNDTYPNDLLYTRHVPTFFVIDPKTQDLLAERIGYQPKSAFIEFLGASK
ncbi:MAG: thioredoxin family protein [Campylobacterales bacterium]